MPPTLHRIVADRVVDALTSREHVLISPGAENAFLIELEALIEPTIASVSERLRNEEALYGERTTSFGDERTDDAIEALVKRLTDQLMESDNVEDIFAEDRLIRRDAFRAIANVLNQFRRGEIDVAEEDTEEQTLQIELEQLGYVAATVAQVADPSILEDALKAAGQAIDATFVGCDLEQKQVTFTVQDLAPEATMALEEATTEALIELVDQDAVQLPCIEQVLQVDEQTAQSKGFSSAIDDAVEQVRQSTSSLVACLLVDECTLLATLTPLTQPDAAQANEHFDRLLQTLEANLSELD